MEVSMSRVVLSLLLLLPACETPDPASDPVAALESPCLDGTREVLVGDVVHYSWLVRVGAEPNAQIRVHRVVRERAPGRARPTSAALLLTHGDFATFVSNFVPSLVSPEVAPRHTLAVYLAERGVDVWGVDRRWATVPAGPADVSDFAA